MFCRKCGTKIEDGNKFCTNCGEQVEFQNSNSQQTVENNSQAKPNDIDYTPARNMCIASAVLTYLSGPLVIILSSILSPLEELLSMFGGLFPIAGIVLLIMTRVKYPDYKPAKILTWVYLISLIIGLIAFVILVVFCVWTCSNMSTSGC